MVYVTAIEGSRRAGLAEKTIRNWIQSGILKTAVKRGRAWRIDLDELLRMKAERALDDPRDDLIAQLSLELTTTRAELQQARAELEVLRKRRAGATHATAAATPVARSESKNSIGLWLSEHGVAKDAARRWPDLPLQRPEAFRYAQKYYPLHDCDKAECICHELLKT